MFGKLVQLSVIASWVLMSTPLIIPESLAQQQSGVPVLPPSSTSPSAGFPASQPTNAMPAVDATAGVSPNQPTSKQLSPNQQSPNQPTANPASPSWVVFDRTTGRWYQQQLVPVTVPSVRWESRPVQQTRYEIRPEVARQTHQQTIYVPQTQTQMVPRIAGWWNPFRQPALTYSYQPVTTWVPKTVPVETSAVVPKIVPTQQTVQVPTPVPTTEVRQQLVQTEIAPPTGGVRLGAVAVNPQPIFQLARRSVGAPGTTMNPTGKLPTRLSQVNTVAAPRMTGSSMMAVAPPPAQLADPRQSGSLATQTAAPNPTTGQTASPNAAAPNPSSRQLSTPDPTASTPASPATNTTNLTAGVYPPYPAYQPMGYQAAGYQPRGPFPIARSLRSGLRPITSGNGPLASLLQPIYPAPLSSGSGTSSSINRTAGRDEMQAGLAPTILR